jgi:hypothetical protein
MSAQRNALVKYLQADVAGVMALATDVYPKQPPEGAQFPFVQVSARNAPAPERVFQAIASEDSTFLVEAIDQNTSPKRAGQIAAAIRARLDRAVLTIAGFSRVEVLWLQDVDRHEEFNGQIFQYEGGIYQVFAEV